MHFPAGSSGTAGTLERYERQDTGYYNLTHSVSITNTGGHGIQSYFNGIVVVGDYVYQTFCITTGLVVGMRRFDKATLANETAMTVPSITWAAQGIHTWTDGTYIYINPENSTTTGRYSISGTTISTAGTGTSSTTISNVDTGSSFAFNGKEIYQISGKTSTITATNVAQIKSKINNFKCGL